MIRIYTSWIKGDVIGNIIGDVIGNITSNVIGKP